MVLIAVCVNVGMWFERFVIVVTSLHRDYLPSSWMMFYPTWVDILQLVGGFGLFTVPFLLFIRFVPMVAISEVKACLPAASPHHPSDSHAALAVETAPEELMSFEGDPDEWTYGAQASFKGPAELLEAARSLHEHGYCRFDTHSPFPIHGMEKAMGQGRSLVPWFTLAGGLFGLAFAQTLQWYQSAVAYPLITGGKPLNSTEAFLPITFETTILYAAFGAVAGMLILNGLPRLYHPVFRGTSFPRASGDGFILTVEADDPRFDWPETLALLAEAGGTDIELLDR